MTKIKICGLKRTEDISYVNELLPDFAGFVFAKSSRQVDAKKTAELKKQLSPKIKADPGDRKASMRLSAARYLAEGFLRRKRQNI